MSDKDKRSAFTTVVISDIENNTQEVVYNSYTLPLLFYNGTNMSKLIEKIEAVPDKGITIQNDIVFYDNTYASAEDTFEYVLITLNELEGSQTHSLAELIDDGFTITPFINSGGGGDSDFSTAKITLNLTPPDGVAIVNEWLLSTYVDFPDDEFGYNTAIMATNHVCTVLLYQGAGHAETVSGDDAELISYPIKPDTVVTAGGVEYDEEKNYFIFTGDGSITGTLESFNG